MCVSVKKTQRETWGDGTGLLWVDGGGMDLFGRSGNS